MRQLDDSGRLRVLREAGLSAAPDPGMDRFARLVARLVRVPIALVTLLEPGRQIFPGMSGLAEPWASRRETPLSQSLCQHVVASARPLVVADIREHPLTCDSRAFSDLGVVGYAGMPLTDVDGHVLGSLCAIDTAPRSWADQELEDLADLAAACTAELRLRAVSRQAERARADADRQAEQVRRALGRSELLLRAAEDLAQATSLPQVRQRIDELVRTGLRPAWAGLSVLEHDRLRRIADPDPDHAHAHAHALERDHGDYGTLDQWPSAVAVTTNRMVLVRGEQEVLARFPAAVDSWRQLGLETLVCLPLAGARGPLGVLGLAWSTPHDLDVTERAVLVAVAGYAAQAVERVRFVEDRMHVARALQEAMLTELPALPGLEIAALYRPSGASDLVGGDWYDAYELPAWDSDGAPPALVLTAGDVTGHDVRAAALMGRARSMLRQAHHDHPGAGPAVAVSAFERANATLGTGISGTLVHAQLSPRLSPATGERELTWTNAGHPPPLLALPDGTVQVLHEHGILVHPALVQPRRAQYRRLLPPGATLVLYTDGLVDQPDGPDLDKSVARAASLLAAHAGLPLRPLVTRLADDLGGPSPADDVVLLALRLPCD